MALPTVSERDSTKNPRPRSFFGIVAAVLGRPSEWFAGLDGSNVRRALGFVALVHLIVDPVQRMYDALLGDRAADTALLRALLFVVVGPLAGISWVALMALVAHAVVRLG